MKKAFTMLELVFVIILIGILAKYGTNLLSTAYQNSAATSINNRLTVNTELTLQQIANRLQYRIKDSVIARTNPGSTPMPLPSASGSPTVIEWIGYDIDGWLGRWDGASYYQPAWSGFIDVSDPGAIAALTYLDSPITNTTIVDTIIQDVRANGSGTTIDNSAIFFTGANSDIQTDYGWNGNIQNNQSITAAHRINNNTPPNTSALMDATGSTFVNTDVYENYKLAWTAYAIRLMDFNGDGATFVNELGNTVSRLDLVLYYDYQPWEGDDMVNDGTPVLLMEDVDTFKFSGEGESIRIQICANERNALAGGKYAICKEKAIF